MSRRTHHGKSWEIVGADGGVMARPSSRRKALSRAKRLVRRGAARASVVETREANLLYRRPFSKHTLRSFPKVPRAR